MVKKCIVRILEKENIRKHIIYGSTAMRLESIKEKIDHELNAQVCDDNIVSIHGENILIAGSIEP